MTDEQIIEMAKQAGYDEHHAKFDTRIEAFAKLVAKNEREACAKVADEHDFYGVSIARDIRARGEA